MPNQVIENLLHSEAFAVEHDNVPGLGEQKYKSILFSCLTWIPQNYVTNWDGTLQEQLLYNLDDSCFDQIKDNDEFIKLKNRLKESNRIK